MASNAIATNKKAFRDYFFQEKWECGIALKGGEVKSVRAGEVNFKDSFARIEKGEVVLYNLHITSYRQASFSEDEPDRPRKLLLHKKEISKLTTKVMQKRFALIPTKLYFTKRGLVKVELGLGTGKKLYDKREDIKKRDVEMGLKRLVRARNR